jgi:hypothetical protein
MATSGVIARFPTALPYPEPLRVTVVRGHEVRRRRGTNALPNLPGLGIEILFFVSNFFGNFISKGLQKFEDEDTTSTNSTVWDLLDILNLYVS